MAQPGGAENDVYRALPDSDLAASAEKRSSRHSARDTDAADGAAEKLLKKEEARIVSADMADAKYKVGGQTNGEAKIEIDENKKSFTGLTKEELLKYQNDPFWVRLRWAMFVLFWAMWLLMLAVAIGIIVYSPKCTPPAKWYIQGPILDLTPVESYKSVQDNMKEIQDAGVTGVVVSASLAGDIYDENVSLAAFKQLAESAKNHKVKLIVEMIANFIPISHPWFNKSENSEEHFKDFLIWAPAKAGSRDPPNNWLSMADKSAWSWSEKRQAFYLHQHAEDTADLNFDNERVRLEFVQVMRRWIKEGASAIRLKHAQSLLVDKTLKDDMMGPPSEFSHKDYSYYSHHATSDRPELEPLLKEWGKLVAESGADALLLSGRVPAKSPYLTPDGALLPLPPADRLDPSGAARALYQHIDRLVKYWPAVEVSGSDDGARELVAFTLLLRATPVLTWDQLYQKENDTFKVDPRLSKLIALRAFPDTDNSTGTITTLKEDQLLASFTRWNSTSYLSVYNPNSTHVAALSGDGRVPDTLRDIDGAALNLTDVSVPPHSTKIFQIPTKVTQEPVEKAKE